MEYQFEIDLNRCLCVHSLLQLVDVSLQTILYIRGIIPEPYQMMEANETPKAKQFRELYKKVTSILKSAFRSFNRGVLEEVLIVLGNTPYAPVDVFRIDVRPCKLHDDVTEMSNEGVKATCTETCGLLSPRDRRKIFTSLACGQQAETAQLNAPKLGKLVKVFISLKTNGKLVDLIEGLEFDEAYEPPEPKRIQQLGVRTIRINSKKCRFEGGNQTLVDDASPKSDFEEIWHQVTHVISSL